MSRREAWLSAGLVFLVALVVRAWAATQITFPQPEDTAYYVDVARNLVAGHGLITDAIWSFATPPLTFNPPRPAFEIWLPLATFLDAIPMALAGSTFGAAQVASILEGSLVAVLAWRLGADVGADLDLPVGRARTLAIGAGLAAGVYLPLVLFSVQPDSTMPFAALVLGFVLLARRVLRSLVVEPAPEVRQLRKLSKAPPRRPKPTFRASSGSRTPRLTGATSTRAASTPATTRATSSPAPSREASTPATTRESSTPATTRAASTPAPPRYDAPSHRRHDQGRHAPSVPDRHDVDGHHARTLLSVFGVSRTTAVDTRGRPVAGLGGLGGLLGLIGLGVLLGLAALTRNDAVYLAIVWLVVGWRATRPAGPWTRRLAPALAIVGIPAIVAFAIYLPWAVRDLFAFGTPLPGQALENALFLNGRDVFAWDQPPTLERYLDAGPLTLIGLRVDGFVHNLGSVLLLLGVPISALGILGLPWAARVPALRSLAGFSLLSFVIATLVFPVATTWGTFLHAAGAIHVLILVSALLVLDRLIERVGRSRDWTRPVAWLGPAAATAASLLLTVALVPAQGASGRATEATYQALPLALDQAGVPLPTDGSPVITDFPIWLSTEDHVHAIALPNEQPSDVLDLAIRFNAKLLVVNQSDDGQWPEILDQEGNETQCFKIVPLPGGALPGAPTSGAPTSGAGAGGASVPGSGDGPLADIVVFQIVCSSTDQTQPNP